MSLRLYKEHGVNPSIEVCCFCGAKIGLALLGAAVKGEAPHYSNLGHACERCDKIFKSGGAFIYEAYGPSVEQRTNRMVAIRKEAKDKIFGVNYEKSQIIHLEPPAFEKLFGEYIKIKGDKEHE